MYSPKIQAIFAGMLLFRKHGPLKYTDTEFAKLCSVDPELVSIARIGYNEAYKSYIEDIYGG